MVASILRVCRVERVSPTRDNRQVATVQTPTMFSARNALTRLAGVGAVGSGIAAAHLLFGIGLPCPVLSLTGLQCPLCGATRAAGALASGDFAAAWSFNALLVVGVILLGCCAAAWLVEVVGGPALRPPRRLRPLTQNKVYVAVGMVAAVFMVVRNLV